MAFTQCFITHTFQNADGTWGSGQVLFTLTGRMTNSSTTLVPATITASLDSNGELGVELTSNEDAGTVPTTSQWRVDLQLQGMDPESFFITVPTSASSPVDLGTLLPATG